MRLSGKTAIITGAGGGIGRVTAVLFAREGANLVVTDYNANSGLETLAEIQAGGGEGLFVRGDVTKPEDAERIVEAALAKYGQIDILFNNAGISRIGTVETLPVEEFDQVYGVNVRGPFLMSKYVIPHMRKRRSGTIINMGSTAALAAAINMTSYGVTKAAILGLTRAMAADYAQEGIRVNCLCPGATETPLLKQILRERPPEQSEAFIKKHPIGRLAQPGEIALAALFLASDDSSFMTGAAMSVDGGYTAV